MAEAWRSIVRAFPLHERSAGGDHPHDEFTVEHPDGGRSLHEELMDLVCGFDSLMDPRAPGDDPGNQLPALAHVQR